MSGPGAPVLRRALRLLRPLPPRFRDVALSWRSAPVRLGAVARIRDDDGRWLVVRHSYRRGWGLPGGGLHRGEDPHDGLRRELVEELGVQVELGHTVPVLVPGRRNLAFVVDGRVLSGVPEPRSPEIEQVRWCRPAEIDDPDRFLAAVLGDVMGHLDAGRSRPMTVDLDG